MSSKLISSAYGCMDFSSYFQAGSVSRSIGPGLSRRPPSAGQAPLAALRGSLGLDCVWLSCVTDVVGQALWLGYIKVYYYYYYYKTSINDTSLSDVSNRSKKLTTLWKLPDSLMSTLSLTSTLRISMKFLSAFCTFCGFLVMVSSMACSTAYLKSPTVGWSSCRNNKLPSEIFQHELKDCSRHSHTYTLHGANLFKARNTSMNRFCLECVCVSVRVPKTDYFITTSHFLFTRKGGGKLDPFRHVRLSVHLSVCPSGPGCLSGAFCPFNGLCSTPNHFLTLDDKKA